VQTAGTRASEVLAGAPPDNGHVDARQRQLARQHEPPRTASSDHHRMFGHRHPPVGITLTGTSAAPTVPKVGPFRQKMLGIEILKWQRLIVAPVGFAVLVVGQGIEEAEDVFSGLFVETVEDNGVGCVVLGCQFDRGIVDNYVAVVADAKFGSDLQNDFRAFGAGGHGGSGL
jgi:hypothetical protein